MASNDDLEGYEPSSKQDQLRLPPSCDPPGPGNPAKQKAWIIFGGTGHMGSSVVRTAVAKGDIVTVVGSSRTEKVETVAQMFADVDVNAATSGQHVEFSQGKGKGKSPSPALSPKSSTRPTPHNLLCLVCDVRVRSSITKAIQTHLEHWGEGNLDIVANCSVYGVLGSCEDQDDAELRDQFETNFWGTLNIVQLGLPYLRNRKGGGGRFLIFSSTSGGLGVPGMGPFCATKYAVEGLIESMLYEIDAFDVRATLVSPGYVRRMDPPEDQQGFDDEEAEGKSAAARGGESNGTKVMNDQSHLPVYGSFDMKPPSAPYKNPTSPASHARRVVQWLLENQPTSLVKAAELVWQLAHCSYPPLRLLLGNFAVDSVRDRLKTIIEEIEDWKFLSFGEDVDPDKARERILGREPSREPPSEDEDDPDPAGANNSVDMNDSTMDHDAEDDEMSDGNDNMDDDVATD